ncbi:MFS transporter [Cellulomonas sp. PhB143]|uniref:MFS transporter n=1 Tax=Cellulomonas sp. PhB143 TaxID=2485186 RepID=UPI000F9A91A8|nr:MFS transporter [Cellulomonas sp. PhB143]ROS75321.1 putative MFS family arabinose efflux permease [Cellulomonas sp. PhB143]
MSAARPWRVVFWLIFVCSYAGNQFTPLLLMYKQVDHYSTTVVNEFLGVYVFGLAPALLLSGALSDRHGRKPLMYAGTCAALLASTFLAFSEYGTAGIFVGRWFAGVTVGVAMAVGNSWLKELSQAPYDPTADVQSGARRASLAFTLGSAVGALVAGLIAQLSDLGAWLPFVIHIAVAAPFLWLIRRVPETSRTGGARGSFWNQFRIPAAGHRRFRRVVLVAAPWIFGGAAIAYGYVPVLLADASGEWGLGYATLLTCVTLVVAALVQPAAKRLDTPSSARGLVACLAATVVGLAVVVAAVALDSLVLGVVASVAIGVAIGIGLVSSLLEVQRIADPEDLAGLTGVFYAVSYCGFLAPAVLSALSGWVAVPVLLGVLVVLAVLTTVALLRAYRSHLPTGHGRWPLGSDGNDGSDSSDGNDGGSVAGGDPVP